MRASEGKQETLSFESAALANQLFGPHNIHLSLIEQKTGAKISSRGTKLFIDTKDLELKNILSNLFAQAYGLLQSGQSFGAEELEHGLNLLQANEKAELGEVFKDGAIIASGRKTINTRNIAQQHYVSSMRKNEMVFAIGPAGTGKTYLAVALALSMLLERRVKRIILTRPAVEAGEKLGFLPGDMADKVNPYLRPLYDALHDMLGGQKLASMQEAGIIEVAPLAFMRGRTLNDAFIILDEAQNTTREQMKMFLTRLGFGSRAVITGDITQIDLPSAHDGERSGLVHALKVLHGVKGISFSHFNASDVVRHALVGRIVSAYDKFQEK